MRATSYLTRFRVALVPAATLALSAVAGIPEPPATLHGRAFINGVQVRAGDDVTILARVDGVRDPIGAYHMGDVSGAGDNYVLRLRLESLADGLPQSDDAGVIGQTAMLLIRTGDGAELDAGTYPLTQSGAIETRDLSASSGCTGNEKIGAAKCVEKRGKITLTIKLVRGMPGDAYQIDLTTGDAKSGVLNTRGKAKEKFKDRAPGESGTATAAWGCGAVKTKDYACP